MVPDAGQIILSHCTGYTFTAGVTCRGLVGAEAATDNAAVLSVPLT